jgi:hypothetical protein
MTPETKWLSTCTVVKSVISPPSDSTTMAESVDPVGLEQSMAASLNWGAIHQLLNIILQLRILVLLLMSTLPYVVKVKNYS